jgi:hypothetical protein
VFPAVDFDLFDMRCVYGGSLTARLLGRGLFTEASLTAGGTGNAVSIGSAGAYHLRHKAVSSFTSMCLAELSFQ